MVEKVHNPIPGGRARGREVKHYLPQFAQIFSDFRPRCGDFVNFHIFAAYVQKKLDKTRSVGYNGAGPPKVIGLLLFLAQETSHN